MTGADVGPLTDNTVPASSDAGATTPDACTTTPDARSGPSSPARQATPAAPEEHELRCTLCGLRACWTG